MDVVDQRPSRSWRWIGQRLTQTTARAVILAIALGASSSAAPREIVAQSFDNSPPTNRIYTYRGRCDSKAFTVVLTPWHEERGRIVFGLVRYKFNGHSGKLSDAGVNELFSHPDRTRVLLDVGCEGDALLLRFYEVQGKAASELGLLIDPDGTVRGSAPINFDQG